MECRCPDIDELGGDKRLDREAVVDAEIVWHERRL